MEDNESSKKVVYKKEYADKDDEDGMISLAKKEIAGLIRAERKRRGTMETKEPEEKLSRKPETLADVLRVDEGKKEPRGWRGPGRRGKPRGV